LFFNHSRPIFQTQPPSPTPLTVNLPTIRPHNFETTTKVPILLITPLTQPSISLPPVLPIEPQAALLTPDIVQFDFNPAPLRRRKFREFIRPDGVIVEAEMGASYDEYNRVTHLFAERVETGRND